VARCLAISRWMAAYRFHNAAAVTLSG